MYMERLSTELNLIQIFTVNTTRGDFEESIYFLKYLEATQNVWLILRAGQTNQDLILKCYVDALILRILIRSLIKATVWALMIRFL